MRGLPPIPFIPDEGMCGARPVEFALLSALRGLICDCSIQSYRGWSVIAFVWQLWDGEAGWSAAGCCTKDRSSPISQKMGNVDHPSKAGPSLRSG